MPTSKPTKGTMAGLYEVWRDDSVAEDALGAFLWFTVILATAATDELGQIHDRIPRVHRSEQGGQQRSASNRANRPVGAGDGVATRQASVPTPQGEARLWVDEPGAAGLRLVLGHGAGGGPGAVDLDVLARVLPSAGISVVRVEQPWRVAGRPVAPAPARLDEAWLAALETVPRDVPLVVGGRSAGARVACRTAAAVGAAGVLALAFPLHPPGKPERTRLAELSAAAERVPTLVVQGERDAFGKPAEFPASRHRLVEVPHADHGMKVPKAFAQDQALDAIAEAVTEWLVREFHRPPPG